MSKHEGAVIYSLLMLAGLILLGGATWIGVGMYRYNQRACEAIVEQRLWITRTHYVTIKNKTEVQEGSHLGWNPLYVTVTYDSLPGKLAQEWEGQIISNFTVADRSQWQSLVVGRHYQIRYGVYSSQIWESGAGPNDTVTALPHREF